MGREAVSGKPLVDDIVTPRWGRRRGDEVERGAGRKVQVSVARYLRTPPYAAKRRDLVLVLRAAYAASATGARLSLATVIMDR